MIAMEDATDGPDQQLAGNASDSSRGNIISSNMGDSESVSGWIYKKGNKGMIKAWKRRWFVVDRKTSSVSYFESPDQTSPKGTFNASEIFAVERTASTPNGFEVSTVSGRIYKLKTELSSEMDAWMKCFVDFTAVKFLTNDRKK